MLVVVLLEHHVARSLGGVFSTVVAVIIWLGSSFPALSFAVTLRIYSPACIPSYV